MVRHLYVHIPFCVRRCSYCDFAIAVRKRIPAGEYVQCVQRELEQLHTVLPTSHPGWAKPATPRGSAGAGDAPPAQVREPDAGLGTRDTEPDASLETLYLGGGTPSLLGADALSVLLGSLLDSTSSPCTRDAVEITLEANPEDVSLTASRAWRRAGVNRVSLGAQSFDDRVLRWMHRSHDAARITEALRTLRAAGIDNISLDLIFALPADLERDWSRDLDEALALLPSHLSLYGLTVEERTPLARWISRGATSAPDDERYAAEYLVAHERLAAAGYHFYEVSNACRDDFRSRHNSAYWGGRDYVGLGPAAHSFDGRMRRWNVAQWETYRRAIEAGGTAVESHEVLTAEQRDIERVYLALRTDAGLAASACPPDRLTAWAGQGWVEVVGGRVQCTPEGWLRLDALVRDLTGLLATV
jgi:putative oxygen-independent coproporphyrinogen III oxidase